MTRTWSPVVSASKTRADAFSTFCMRLIMEMDELEHLRPKEDQRNSRIEFDVGPAVADQSPSVKSVGITGQITGSRADIIIADERLHPQAVELYNAMFRPKREADFFKRRFMGRYNVLTLLARIDEKPVGFWVGFELKPGMFYHWMGAVVPDLRRHGVGRQLQDAQQAWEKDHGYEYIRCECMNHQREFVHFAIDVGYDIDGVRWDSTHARSNMW